MKTCFIFLAFSILLPSGYYCCWPQEPQEYRDQDVLNCGENETVNECPAFCTFDESCESYVQGWIKDCSTTAPPGEPCKPRCDCSEGFVRIKGVCQLPDQCCPDNEEVVDCPAACEETCEEKPKPGCMMEDCYKRKCRCKEGYVRDDKGNCIKSCDCPPVCSGTNQELALEVNPGQPSCSTPFAYSMNATTKGLQCRCIDGYLWHKGQCIPATSCPNKVCKGKNEVHWRLKAVCFRRSCNSNGYGSCADPGYYWPPGCECAPGYIRNIRYLNTLGDCVKPEQCPKMPACPVGEELVPCPDPCYPDPRTCLQFLLSEISSDPCIPSKDPVPCKPECICPWPKLRNQQGVCVERAECKTCKGINEEFQNCGSACPPSCTKRNPACKTKCQPGCFCKKGFIRDKEVKGKCIKPCDCKTY